MFFSHQACMGVRGEDRVCGLEIVGGAGRYGRRRGASRQGSWGKARCMRSAAQQEGITAAAAGVNCIMRFIFFSVFLRGDPDDVFRFLFSFSPEGRFTLEKLGDLREYLPFLILL